MSKHQLILDVAGVLVTNMSPRYWKEIAELDHARNKDLKTIFKQNLRELFWSGVLPEEAFWDWLRKECPNIDIPKAQSMLSKHLQIMPAFERIPEWSQQADVHLISNHREEWLAPLLKPLAPYLHSVTVSSNVGFCKPQAEIYELVHSKLDRNSPVTFVDDQQKNLKPAQDLRWSTVLADREGQWIERVELILGNVNMEDER